VNRIAAKDPSPEDISTLNNLSNLLESEFLPELLAQSNADGLEHASKITEHDLCTTHKNMRLGPSGDVTLLLAQVVAKRAKHQACRKATKSYDVFKADVDLVYAGAWKTSAPATGHTKVPALSSMCDNQATFFDDVAEYIKADGPVSELCALDQESFEDTWCNWLNAKVSTCLALEHCVNQANAAASKALVLARDANRRSILHSIRILQCRLQHITQVFNHDGGASNFSETDDCSATAAPAEDYYGLSLQDPVAAVFCLADADISNPNQPSLTEASVCTQWRNQEYSGEHWSSALHSNVDTCLATCAVPTTVTPVDYGSDWTLILQMGLEPYTPTSDAVGVVNAAIHGVFAKLSDAAINSLPHGGDVSFDYYLFSSDAYDGVSKRDSILVRAVVDGLGDGAPFDDTALGYGLSNKKICFPYDTVNPAECTEWKDIEDRVGINTVDHQQNGCSRWLSDDTKSRRCRNPMSSTQRCFNRGSAKCAGAPQSDDHVMRTNVMIHKLVAPNPSPWVQKTVGSWTAAAKGASCDTTCGSLGKVCNSAEPAKLNTWEKVRDVMETIYQSSPETPFVPSWQKERAGIAETQGGRTYAGAPFVDPRYGGLWFLTPGNQFSCGPPFKDSTATLCFCDDA